MKKLVGLVIFLISASVWAFPVAENVSSNMVVGQRVSITIQYYMPATNTHVDIVVYGCDDFYFDGKNDNQTACRFEVKRGATEVDMTGEVDFRTLYSFNLELNNEYSILCVPTSGVNVHRIKMTGRVLNQEGAFDQLLAYKKVITEIKCTGVEPDGKIEKKRNSYSVLRRQVVWGIE